MNILFLIEALAAGGAERQLVNLMNGLAQKGHNIFLLTWIDNNHYDEHDVSNVKWKRIQRKHKFDFSILGEAKKLIKTYKIQLVQGFLDSGNMYAFFSVKLFCLRIPVVVSERSSERRLRGLSFLHKAYVHKKADLTIANSVAGYKFVEKISNNKARVKVIRNGFILDDFLSIYNSRCSNSEDRYKGYKSKFLFTNIARFNPLKQQFEILVAFKKLFEKYPHIRLVFIGKNEGEYYNVLRKYAMENGLEKVVTFPGHSKNIKLTLVDTSVFILNSKYEGSPNVLVEAMGSGIPVISRNVGDVSYYLGTSDNFQMLNLEGDSLMKRMEQFIQLDSSKLMELEMGNFRRIHGELRCNIESLVLNYENVYKQLIKS